MVTCMIGYCTFNDIMVDERAEMKACRGKFGFGGSQNGNFKWGMG